MVYKYLLSTAVIFLVLGLTGCETVKGSFVGAGTGVQKDYQNTEKFVKELGPKIDHADKWIQKNMW